jgi:hypothetical protein
LSSPATIVTSSSRIGAPFISRIARYAAAGALLAFCLLSLPLLAREISFLPLLDEAGYGDSYIIYDVQRYQKTGVIYPDLSQPPYLPAQYSPVVYVFYSLPGRLAAWSNPFVGPRLLTLLSFFACAAVVISIVVVLVPVRFAWAWGLLLVSSIISMWSWVLQIRGDFPGIFFGLLAIRLLMSRARWSVLLAGLCAGLATQFKFTFVAAAGAGVLWFLIQRQWSNLARFAVAAALASAVPYVLFSLHEPRMLSQILALSPGIIDVFGDLAFVTQTVGNLVLVLAMFGLPPVVRHFWPRWALLIIFATLSFAVAGLTDLQAGGNDNYFFETLFAVVPLAVLGAVRLVALAPRNPVVTFFLVVLFAIHFLAPRVLLFYGQIVSSQDTVASRNDTFRNVERVLQGQRILSTVPRLALIDPQPPLVEPVLLYYLQRLGKIDPDPLFSGIRDGAYGVVITSSRPVSHRGLLLIGPDLRAAIAATYRPSCALGGWLFHLPVRSNADTDRLEADLARIGCAAVSAATAAGW